MVDCPYLAVKWIPLVVKLTDKLTAEFPLLDHQVVSTLKQESILLLRQIIL